MNGGVCMVVAMLGSACLFDAAHLQPLIEGSAAYLQATFASASLARMTRPPAPFAGPFCHRSLLTLEEKKVPYSTTLIDFANKPQWLLDVNPAGSVPVMKVRAKATAFHAAFAVVEHWCGRKSPAEARGRVVLRAANQTQQQARCRHEAVCCPGHERRQHHPGMPPTLNAACTPTSHLESGLAAWAAKPLCSSRTPPLPAGTS